MPTVLSVGERVSRESAYRCDRCKLVPGVVTCDYYWMCAACRLQYLEELPLNELWPIAKRPEEDDSDVSED